MLIELCWAPIIHFHVRSDFETKRDGNCISNTLWSTHRIVGEHHPGKLVESADFLTPEQKQAILGLNVLKFLGLDPNDFVASTSAKQRQTEDVTRGVEQLKLGDKGVDNGSVIITEVSDIPIA